MPDETVNETLKVEIDPRSLTRTSSGYESYDNCDVYFKLEGVSLPVYQEENGYYVVNSPDGAYFAIATQSSGFLPSEENICLEKDGDAWIIIDPSGDDLIAYPYVPQNSDTDQELNSNQGEDSSNEDDPRVKFQEFEQDLYIQILEFLESIKFRPGGEISPEEYQYLLGVLGSGEMRFEVIPKKSEGPGMLKNLTAYWMDEA